MLQIPNLDDISYEQLLTGAVHKIPFLTSEWTDFNRSDPGITTLEMYAWLTDMLNYYMNAVGRIHTLKYMKLLGINELPGQAACAFVCMDAQKPMVLLKDFPVYAGEKSFICVQEEQISDNRFSGLFSKKGGRVTDLTAFAGTDGSFARVFRADASTDEQLYFRFEKPLAGTVKLYITVREHSERHGLPSDFTLSKVRFSCYDGREWREIKDVTDGTNGFLQSGVLTLHISDKHARFEEERLSGYFLRAELLENQYDVAPELGSCYLNPVFMIQKEPVCRRLGTTVAKGGTYQIPCYLSGEELISVALQEENGEYCVVASEKAAETDRCVADVQTGTITFLEGETIPEGTPMDILLTKQDYFGDVRLGVTNGCAGQEFPCFVENPYELEVILEYEKDGRIFYTHWNYVERLESASYEDCVFSCNKEENTLVFGDGVHGRVPDAGRTVRISACSLCSFEQGNVLTGEIRRIHDSRYEGLCAFNASMAFGGRGRDSLAKMQARLEETVLKQNRVVSPGDYERMVKEIPGLMIRGARLVPASEYCKNHAITYKPYDTYLVVCPVSMKPREELSDRYHDYICEYLEPYRMLNTRLLVVAPVYAGISFSGKLCILGNAKEAQSRIERLLAGYIEKREKDCCFGALLSYGDIYMQLEALDCVERVEELHLFLDGEMGYKNDKGDILLNSDCLPYTGKIEIEYKG